MAEITLYQHHRQDGAERVGVEIEGYRFWDRFFPDGEVYDPALLWSIDVVFTGDGLPMDPEAVKTWLQSHLPSIQSGLQEAVEKLQVGFDNEFEPCKYRPDVSLNGAEMRVVCSAVRRMEAREMGHRVSMFKDMLPQLLAELERTPESELAT